MRDTPRDTPPRAALLGLLLTIAVGACAGDVTAGESTALRAVRERLDVGAVQRLASPRLDVDTASPIGHDDRHKSQQHGLLNRTVELFENWAGFGQQVNYQKESVEQKPEILKPDKDTFDLKDGDLDQYGFEEFDFEPDKPQFEYSLTPAPGITPRWDAPPKKESDLDLNLELPQPGMDEEPLPGEPYESLPAPGESVGEGAAASLPSLADELRQHGGSYIYCPEGDRLGWPSGGDAHYEYLRLPEWWQKPRPATAFAEFLGADPVKQYPLLKWFGPAGNSWEPRFVGYGAYQVFGFAFEQNHQRADAIGDQLLLDLDLRLTGTERFHVQYRPLGKRNTGGSYYQFNDPAGYVDNSTGEPDRYWFEGELYSMFSNFLDPFAVRDYHVVAGKFPFFLHNTLLINDEIIGVVVNKNTILGGGVSNVNVQAIGGFNDVDTYPNQQTRITGVHVTADVRRMFFQGTYIFAAAEKDSSRDAHYMAFSGTKLMGPWTTAVRALFKIGDPGGTGSGQLFVWENNFTRVWDSKPCGIEYGAFYANVFGATEGWNSLAGSNFNRLRTAFEVNPLVTISSGVAVQDNVWGAAAGVQLFRHHEDESIIPEIAFQSPQGEPVWGVGLRYLRKTSRRTFFEVLGVGNFSNDPTYRRNGVFVDETILF